MRAAVLWLLGLAIVAVAVRWAYRSFSDDGATQHSARTDDTARSLVKEPIPTPPTTQQVAEERLRAQERQDAHNAMLVAFPFINDLSQRHQFVAMPQEEEILRRMEERYAHINWKGFDTKKFPLMQPLGESLGLYRRAMDLSSKHLELIHKAIDAGVQNDDTFQWGDRELTSQIRDIGTAAWSKEEEFLADYKALEDKFGHAPG
jgi:hypothetical protein